MSKKSSGMSDPALVGARAYAPWRGRHANRVDSAMQQPFAELGRRLRLTQEALDLTAEALCREIDCHPTAWSHYVNGRREIPPKIARRLRDRYRITLDWIYCGDPSGLPRNMRQSVQF